ncbi:MAG: hypothetical protein GY935_14580 [Gammaproteobacteria bacterium]|nr:hypothetical protein [Gammaproteobacteria bacterium]
MRAMIFKWRQHGVKATLVCVGFVLLLLAFNPLHAADTVTITKAKYVADKDKLRVKATSSGSPDAVLTVVGYGVMKFKDGGYVLRLKPVAPLPPVPSTLTVVSSLGGSDTSTVVGGSDDDGGDDDNRQLVVARVAGEVRVKPENAKWGNATAVDYELEWCNEMGGGEPGAIKSNITVKAIHNGTDIAFLLEWSDATRNADIFGPLDFSDSAAIMFNANDHMGTPTNPVNIWFWRARPENVAWSDSVPNLISAAEHGTITHTESDDNIQAFSQWSGSQWQLVLLRPLEAIDHDDQYQLYPGAVDLPVSYATFNGKYRQRGGSKWITDVEMMKIEP